MSSCWRRWEAMSGNGETKGTSDAVVHGHVCRVRRIWAREREGGRVCVRLLGLWPLAAAGAKRREDAGNRPPHRECSLSTLQHHACRSFVPSS